MGQSGAQFNKCRFCSPVPFASDAIAESAASTNKVPAVHVVTVCPYPLTTIFSSSSNDFPFVSGIILQTKKKKGIIITAKNKKMGPT